MKYIFKYHEIFVLFLLAAYLVRVVQWEYRKVLKDSDDTEVDNDKRHFNLSAAWAILWLVGLSGLFVSLRYEFVQGYGLLAYFVLVMGLIRLVVFWNIPNSDYPPFYLPWTSLIELVGVSIGISIIEPWYIPGPLAVLIAVGVILRRFYIR